jgi:DNA-binding transcriptional LysR family regulator
MDTRQFDHFLAAIEHGNLRAAAEELHLSQPALTKSLQRLEASLGVRLFERGRFGVVPTMFGTAFARRARLLKAELARARRELSDLKGATAGHATIGSGPTEAADLVPIALDLLSRKSPQATIGVEHGLNEWLMPAVRHGDIEFAVSSVPLVAADPEIEHEILHDDYGFAAARAGHPLTRKKNLRLSDLLGYDWILARRNEIERRSLDDAFLADGLPPPRPSVETTSTTLMKAMISNSDFLTFMPAQLVKWDIRAGRIAKLDIELPGAIRHVGITRRRDAVLSPLAAALQDVLREVSRDFEPSKAAA